MNFGIVLAAGSGKRFGSEKQLRLIDGIPLYQYSLNVFLNTCLFDKILLVCPAGKGKFFHLSCAEVVEGGKERHESVLNALNFLSRRGPFSPDDRVIVHDSARPLICEGFIQLVLQALSDYPAATLGYKITDALKRADENGRIEKEIDRKDLWAVTTPQGFHLKKLIELYQKTDKFLYDETWLFTENGLPVKIVEAGRHNLKVTYPEDLEVAEKLIRKG